MSLQTLDWPQTIGALHRTAHRAGWTGADLDALLKAHDSLAPLFAGWRRASGRSFTSHLVGTAGLTLEFGGRPDDVAAALAHAVYDEGAYGRAAGRFRRDAAAALAQAVSADAAELVAGYTRFDWPAFIDAAERDLTGALFGADPRLLRLRIANELDDALDWPFFTDRWRTVGARECAAARAAARALGWDGLADRAAFVASEMAKVPIASSPGRDGAYFVRPLGYHLALAERLRERLARQARRFGPIRIDADGIDGD